MKKLLCVLLSTLVVLGSCVTLCASALDSENEIGFAVASDLHYVHALKSVDASISDEGPTTFDSESDSLTHQSGYILDEFLNQLVVDFKEVFEKVTAKLIEIINMIFSSYI